MMYPGGELDTMGLGFRAMVLDSQFWTFGFCQQLVVSLIASGLVAVVSMGVQR